MYRVLGIGLHKRRTSCMSFNIFLGRMSKLRKQWRKRNCLSALLSHAAGRANNDRGLVRTHAGAAHRVQLLTVSYLSLLYSCWTPRNLQGQSRPPHRNPGSATPKYSPHRCPSLYTHTTKFREANARS